MVNKNIEVTVWCITFNHEKYVRKTLEGLVAQKTDFNFEVLVHDDASTDGTKKIIEEYVEKYPELIKPLYEEENQYSKGVKITSTFLVPNAKGKYLAFCEGDDYWSDDLKLQKQYDMLETNKNVALVVHKVQCINEDGTIIPNRFYPPQNSGLDENKLINKSEFADMLYFKLGYPFHTSSYFMRKELIESDFYFKLNKKMNGDQCYLRMALNSGDVYYINDIMSCRRMLSKDNWNQRFSKMELSKKVDYYLKDVEADLMFDEFSKYEFHNIIIKSLYYRLFIMVAKIKDSKLKNCFNNFRKKYKKEIKAYKKLRIECFFATHFSRLFLFLKNH